MKTQVLNEEGLSTYDQEIKDYIKSQGMGVTLEEVKALIDSSDKNTTYTLTKNENNLFMSIYFFYFFSIFHFSIDFSGLLII